MLDRIANNKTRLLLGALLLAGIAAADLKVTRRQPVADVLAVVDITGSMNTRDMPGAAGPVSRIAATRTALLSLSSNLPCGSKVGLGIFTERRSFLLFEPIEVCGNYDALAEGVAGLDWRMAWEGDSYISKGLYSAIDLARSLKSDLVFFTDGHEAPPLPFTGIPEFAEKPGEVAGLIVGVGGAEKSPIPKFDEDGKETGFYSVNDVPHDNRIGAAPETDERPEGWNARNAPFGAKAAIGDEHLSSLRADHLKRLATLTGLQFAELGATRDLVNAIILAGRPNTLSMRSSISRWPAAAAVLLLSVMYLPAVMGMLARLAGSTFHPLKSTPMRSEMTA